MSRLFQHKWSFLIFQYKNLKKNNKIHHKSTIMKSHKKSVYVSNKLFQKWKYIGIWINYFFHVPFLFDYLIPRNNSPLSLYITFRRSGSPSLPLCKYISFRDYGGNVLSHPKPSERSMASREIQFFIFFFNKQKLNSIDNIEIKHSLIMIIF